MGYEIAGAWGARMARPDGEVIAFVGDGSYLMLNSDLYSSVLSGHKLIVVLCDNGGYAVIDRLQVGKGGGRSTTCSTPAASPSSSRVDFAPARRGDGLRGGDRRQHRRAGGGVRARTLGRLRTTVICIRTQPDAWSDGGAFWEVGVPEVSDREAVRAARARIDEGKRAQRAGW